MLRQPGAVGSRVRCGSGAGGGWAERAVEVVVSDVVAAERKKRCLESDLFDAGRGGSREAASHEDSTAEASPERRRWKALEGN